MTDEETAMPKLPGASSSSSARTSTSWASRSTPLELIGYDPETGTFPSTVFSGFSPTPLPYRWDVQGESVTITVSYGPLDATFTGSWRDNGTFSGGWRPNPGADETVNVPYDIGGRRVEYLGIWERPLLEVAFRQ